MLFSIRFVFGISAGFSVCNYPVYMEGFNLANELQYILVGLDGGN